MTRPDRDSRLCGPEGRHEATQPGPDGTWRCPCGVLSRRPAPTPKETHRGA